MKKRILFIFSIGLLLFGFANANPINANQEELNKETNVVDRSGDRPFRHRYNKDKNHGFQKRNRHRMHHSNRHQRNLNKNNCELRQHNQNN